MTRTSRATWKRISFVAVLFFAVALMPAAGIAQVVVRVGCFPNITHPQALLGKSNGAFDRALGPAARIDWKLFNAGPAAMEALLAGALDITYIGPNPTINGYVRSHGEAVRIVAGATSGGAALVVRNDSGINRPEDFHGKKIASPQLGNTQDVALRGWLIAHGLKTIDKGGDVQIMPMANPDQLTMFLRKGIDAAWAPEPWASRLIREGNGRLYLDERQLWPKGQFVTAHVIVRTAFLREHPDVVKKFLAAHVELTDWINAHPADAKKALNDQVQKETGKALPTGLVDDAFSRMQVTYDPIRSSLFTSARSAFDAGFLGRQMPDLSGVYDLSVLNQVLKEKGKAMVQ
jgi:NitT/TauT family transport system substrate-binding protein